MVVFLHGNSGSQYRNSQKKKAHHTGADLISPGPSFACITAGLFCLVLLAGCVTPHGSLPAAAIPSVNTHSGSTGAQNIYAIIPEFDRYAEQDFTRSGVPGMAVAIVQNDTVVYLRCFGVRNITTQEPVDPDTRFQLASISKSFTSATIASMVGDGELSWDDRVAATDPGFRLSDPWVTEHVTFRDLLSHRTGLPEYTGDVLQNTFAYNRSEILERLRFVQPTGAFRSSYAYMNADITAAASAAALRAGMPWEDLVQERVFAPAGMMNTSARFADFARSPNHADTYPMDDQKPVAGPLLNDDVNSPAGGVSSTLDDMVRYTRLQLDNGSIDGKQVIAGPALQETHKPQIIMRSSDTGMTAYGLGWEVVAEDGRVRVEHGGDLSSGVSTYITLYPTEKMGIVILTNGFPGGAVLKRAVKKEWDDLYFTGSVQQDWYATYDQMLKAAMKPGASVLMPKVPLPEAPASPQPSRSLAEYTGTYTQQYYGDIRIENNETGLLMYPGHRSSPIFAVPYNGDTFRETDTGTGVYFSAGIDGTIQTVWFDMFDLPEQNGTFTRISP